MSFYIHIDPCKHCVSWNTDSLIIPENSLCYSCVITPSPHPNSHEPLIYSLTTVLPKRSYKWNPTVCNLFRLICLNCCLTQ